jgi:hypothetical protein
VRNDPGHARDTALPAILRRRLERAFDLDLGGVAIVAARAATGPAMLPRALACTDGRTIFFAPGCYQPNTSAGQALIAHEVAHIKQRWLATERPSQPRVARPIIEAEADRAALAFLTDQRIPVLSCDESTALLSWGPAGHYYTVYFASLAAGLSEEVARNNAFFCQMADQVIELDAKQCGFAIGRHEGLVVAADFLVAGPEGLASGAGEVAADVMIHQYMATRAGIRLRRESVLRSLDWDALKAADPIELSYEDLWDVQEGLHCLTGDDAAAETTWRAAKARNCAPGTVACGLALHALGDSFAHRDCDLDPPGNQGGEASAAGVRMFPPPLGHAKPWWDGQGTEIDDMHRRRGLYEQYGRTLFRVLADMAGRDRSATTEDQFISDLREISAIQKTPGYGELDQVVAIRTHCHRRTSKHITSQYLPEIAEPEPIPWQTFFVKHVDHYPLTHNMLTMCIYLARLWSIKFGI